MQGFNVTRLIMLHGFIPFYGTMKCIKYANVNCGNIQIEAKARKVARRGIEASV